MEWLPAEPEKCPYLKDQTARLVYTFAGASSPQEFEELLDHGCRTMTFLVYRPVCSACNACRPLRVDTGTFKPNRAQRRATRINADLRVRHGHPVFTTARLKLLQRYHAVREESRGWRNLDWNASSYRSVFLARVSRAAAEELTIWNGSKLVGVLLAHVTPSVYSLTYHFHEPSLADRSLGTTLIVAAIARARELGRRWVHMGYYVAACPSLQYKASFRPSQALGVDQVWRPWPEAAPGEEPPAGL